MTDVLAIGAHPDDVEIFAGGALARFQRLGLSTTIVHLTRGEKGTRGSADLRKREAEAAAEILGATVLILDLGDGCIEDNTSSRNLLISVIRSHKPRLLIGPYPSDEHPDHAATGALVKACHYLAGIRRAGDDELDAHRSKALWFYPSHEPLDPTLIVDLDAEDVDRLDRAVRCYGSQFHDPTSADAETRLSRPGFTSSVIARRAYFGSRIDRDYGEPFLAARPIALRDPREIL